MNAQYDQRLYDSEPDQGIPEQPHFDAPGACTIWNRGGLPSLWECSDRGAGQQKGETIIKSIGEIAERDWELAQRFETTPASRAFLSTRNLEFVRDLVEKTLAEIHHRPVRINMYDPEVRYEIEKSLWDNKDLWQRRDIAGLNGLNQLLVTKLVKEFSYGMREDRRFEKYAYQWQNQKPWQRPGGQKDRTQAGEVTVRASDYALSEPTNRWDEYYLRDIWSERRPIGARPWLRPQFI